ncbi:unnamed protein product [Blepharisma stoltei]|uniref:DNA-dependent protein kinase catalytic subunit n=1 Tax=Blepharisma stoltei TaxID=1481888 RepID=A0AAU9JWI5_9CILI|nr:unnamed protein product [Blepharisma stoltei]
MERRVEELLRALHALSFTDADSILGELRSLVLNPNLSSAQVAFCSSKLLNSDISLLNFIKTHREEPDRLIWKTMSNSLDLVSDYIKTRSNTINEYIPEIKEVCIQLMAKSTKSSMVKEAALRPLIKLLETFVATKLKDILDPEGMIAILLDNKLKTEEKTMGSTLRGAIYNMLGLLVSHFEGELQHRIPEIQQLIHIRIRTEINKGQKTEERSLAGMMKGLAYGLKSFNYPQEILAELFGYAKALMQPIESRYMIPKAAMKIIAMNSTVFADLITENAIQLFNTLNDLAKTGAYSIKYLAQDCCEQCLMVLADTLSREAQAHMHTFEYILKILRKQIETPQGTQGYPNTLRALGVFSQAIVKFRGEDYLKDLLDKLVELSENYLFSQEEIEEESFKAVMLKQKSLASFLLSYADIARSLTVIPEHILMHFSKVTLEIFKRNMTLIKKYRFLLYQSIAQLFSSLYLQAGQFGPWIKIFVTRAMNELLTIPEEVENPEERVKLASQLWAGILSQECLTEILIQHIVDEIGQFFLNILQTLDLQYSIKGNLADTEIVANSPEEQQFFYQASDFAKHFFKVMAPRLTGWVMPYVDLLNKKSSELPLLPSLYSFLTVIMTVCSKTDFLDTLPHERRIISETIKSLIKRMQGFHDALLGSCLEVCLACPVSLIYSPEENNLPTWVPVIVQALSLGLAHLPLAHSTISALNDWTKKIPMSALEPFLPEILPCLSSYLTVDKISQEVQGGDTEEALIRKKRKTVAFRVVKLLGSLGGFSHYIVPKKVEDIHIAWDAEPRVKFAIPLHQIKLEVFLDPALPRILHLAENATDRKTRVAACELLHSIIIYMLGKNSQIGARSKESNPFAKVYEKLFPVIYNLATDVEAVSRQVFEPLSRQLVRWFAKSRGYEHPETMALLDALMQAVSNPNNAALRNLAGSCMGEFASSVISQPASPVAYFKSILRRIETYSNHPDSTKRLGAVLCIGNILTHMGNNDELVDRFLLEIGHVVMITIRLSHYDKESQEIINLCEGIIYEFLNICALKINILLKTNPKRAHSLEITSFLKWIWEQCLRPERACRENSKKIWWRLAEIVGIDKLAWSRQNQLDIGNRDNYEEYEGIIDCISWLSKEGLIEHNPRLIEQSLTDFALGECAEENIVKKLYSLKATMDYCKLYPNAGINSEFLIKIVVSPNQLGIFPQVETPEISKLYEELRESAMEILNINAVTAQQIIEIWNNFSIYTSERLLKVSLYGFSRIIKLLGNKGQAIYKAIQQTIFPVMVESLSQDTQSQLRKGKALFNFFKETKLSDDDFSILLTTQKVFQNCSELLLDYISSHWVPALKLTFKSLSVRADLLFPILIPILQKGASTVKDSKILPLKDFINEFVECAMPLMGMISVIPSIEHCQIIVKVYCVFLDFCKNLGIFGEGIEIVKKMPQFLQHIQVIIKNLLSPDRAASIKREAINLIAMMWDYRMVIPNYWNEIKPLLMEVQSQHFLTGTQNLRPGKETYEFESLIKGFFELIKATHHIDAVTLIFSLIREEDSGYEAELTHVLNTFIDDQITKEPLGTFQDSFRDFLTHFFNPNIDRNIKHNLRWGLAKRILLPMMDICDEEMLENLVIAHTHQLLGKLNEKPGDAHDALDYFFKLMEKRFVLLFFEKTYARLPSQRLKDNTHKALFGAGSQGNELTKQLINFCGKYRKEKPERFELLGNFDNGNQALREFSSACYACLMTTIRKTQSQEKIFFNFLFKDQVWNAVVEEKENYGFTPQTDFRTKIQEKSNKKAPEKKETTSIAAGYITSSLFSQSQDISYLKPPKKKIIEIPEIEPEVDLELDEINSLPIMKPLLEVIEKMEMLFSETWGNDMPQWMQCLHGDLCNPNNSLSVKLFLIKIILNRPKTFEKWGDQWFEPICNTMTLPNNGGTGFHYFLRDVACLLLYEWEKLIPVGKERSATKFVNYLIRVAADTSKSVLESNLDIIYNLIKKWKAQVTLEHKYIDGMIKKQMNKDPQPEEEKRVIAWKMAGILIYGYAVGEKVGVLDGLENKEFMIVEGLIKCLEFNRKQIILAASEVIGKKLANGNAGELENELLAVLAKKETKDIGLMVAILEKVTIGYPQILNQKNLARKLSEFFGTLSGNSRAQLLKCVLKYAEHIKTSPDFMNLPDLAEYLYRDRAKISNDNEDSHRLALLQLLSCLIDLHFNPSVKKAVTGFIPLLSAYSASPNFDIRKGLYTLMRKAYDEAPNLEDAGRIRLKAKEILVRALGELSPELSDYIVEFWNQQERLGLDLSVRVTQCLWDLYSPSYEELWLLASSHLALKLSELSTDYDKVLFDQPLANIDFEDADIRSESQASFPMTPIFSPSYFQYEEERKFSQKLQTQSSQSTDFAVPRAIPRRIRHFIDGSQASQEELRVSIRKKQMERIEQRSKEQRARVVNTMRKYRTGDFPDIQITAKDLILPLVTLSRLDSEVAGHVWTALCAGLCNEGISNDSKHRIVRGLGRVLESSEKFEPSVISCVHRTLRDIVSVNGELVQELNSQSISNSGIKGFCYQSAIMLLQECILRNEEPVQPKRRKVIQAISGTEKPEISQQNRRLWIALTKVYESMGDLDAVRGIWLQITQQEGSQLSALFRDTLGLKIRGEINPAARDFANILAHDGGLDADLLEEVKKEYLDSLALLGKWEELKNNVPDDVSTLKIRSLLRLDEFGELTDLMNNAPPASLYNAYAYEMAVLSITQDDADRTRYYLDEEFSRFVESWQGLNALSSSAKHKLIQKVQKIYECFEFVQIFAEKKEETADEYVERIQATFMGWKERKPSVYYDELSVWDDVLYSRVLFYDKIKTKQQIENQELKEFKSVLYADTAECPLRLGWFDIAERYLREGMRKRENKRVTDLSLFSPVLRLKAKQLEKSAFAMDVPFISEEFKKLINTADAQQIDQAQQAAFSFLKGQLYRIQTRILLEKGSPEIATTLPVSAKSAYDFLSQSQNTIKNKMKFAQFCDMLLRDFEHENDEKRNILGVCFNRMGIQPEMLARNIVIAVLEAMALGSSRAHDLFPRLLELLKYRNLMEVFSNLIAQVPAWMLIRWISQILAILDKEESSALAEAVHKLVQQYPQTVFYPFKCFTSADCASQFEKNRTVKKNATYLLLEAAYQNYNHLEAFIAALECLSHPEHRYKYFYDNIKEALEDPDPNRAYIEYLSSQMFESVFDEDHPLLGRSLGAYNRKFANDWRNVFLKYFGKSGTKISQMNFDQFNVVIGASHKKILETQRQLSHGNEKLNAFSEWLADYDITEHKGRPIYIPGQHTGLHEPYKGGEVSIVSFNQNLLILNSLRRPKRLGMHGSDEKEYLALVKGGEDLRLDQRIEQLFSLMNQIFKNDPDCARLGITLKTFNVVPMNKRLGIVEWVPNTDPLKKWINKELARHYRINDLDSSDANKNRLSWISSLSSNIQGTGIVDKHLILLGSSSDEIVKNFKIQESLVPWDLIRQVLLGLSTTPESFVYVRKQFIHSLAAISICGYILGIGDRHLENFLLDRSDGGLLAIDFGIAFGNGVSLGIPELVPFRLTRQLIAVLSPEGLQGELRHAMIYVLKSLRKHKNLILDCCEVFIKEPLLDWVKAAKTKEMNASQIQASGSTILSQEEEAAWFPRKKLEIVKKKLSGYNSAHVMYEEFVTTKHAKTNYAKKLVDVIMGPEDSLRRSCAESGLGVDQQVDILIEHATDPNILGRAWIGWLPHI